MLLNEFTIFPRFLSPKGNFFKTKKKAVSFLRNSGGTVEEKCLLEEFMMSKSEQEKILRYMARSMGEVDNKEFPGTNKSQGRMNVINQPDSTWLDGGDLLPAGWKMKGAIGSPGGWILSSKGRMFQTLRQHIKYMVEQGYLPEEIEKVKNKLSMFGWQEDQLLPRGWTYKIKNGEHRYCTGEGDLIKGDKNVLTKLKSSEAETVSDFILFIEKKGFGVRDMSKFKPSPYLPEGWLCSDITNGKHINIICQNGQAFKSYTKAAAFMKADEKYTSFDIEKLYLYPDGHKHPFTDFSKWVKSEYLPPGWMCKPLTRGNHILMKNPVGKTAHSYREAVRIMESDGSYTKGQMERLYQYPDGECHKPIQTDTFRVEKVPS